MRYLRSLMGLSAALTGAQAALAAGEPAPVRAQLRWERAAGAESCLDGEQLTRAVEARWERRVFSARNDADLVLKGRAARKAGRWSVTLELLRKDGTSLGSREIVTAAPECSSLDDSVALATGLMLDVSERRFDVEEAPAAAPAPPAPRPPPTPITIPKDTAPARPSWRFEPTLGVDASVGLLPGFAAGVRMALHLSPPGFVGVELGATHWFPVTRESAGRAVRLHFESADLAVCPIGHDGAAIEVEGCISQRLGAVTAEGQGFDDDRRQTSLLAAFGALARASVALGGPLRAALSAGLEVPLVRYRFTYRSATGEPGEIAAGGPVAATGFAGLAARF